MDNASELFPLRKVPRGTVIIEIHLRKGTLCARWVGIIMGFGNLWVSLSGVGVRVGHFYPSENPYPSHELAGLIWIQTLLENMINMSQCCQLSPLPHSKRAFMLIFEFFYYCCQLCQDR
jgi:hypothetical protein